MFHGLFFKGIKMGTVTAQNFTHVIINDKLEGTKKNHMKPIFSIGSQKAQSIKQTILTNQSELKISNIYYIN